MVPLSLPESQAIRVIAHYFIFIKTIKTPKPWLYENFGHRLCPRNPILWLDSGHVKMGWEGIKSLFVIISPKNSSTINYFLFIKI